MLAKGVLLSVVLLATLCIGGTIHVPDDYAVIQAAIDAAIEGDTVLVAPGEYVITEPITFRGKGITVRGETGPETTTIRMAEVPSDLLSASVVIFDSSETNTAVLEGLSLTAGKGTTWDFNLWLSGGGGVLCHSNSSPTLVDCRISGNTADSGGGLYCAQESSPALRGCTISGNAAWGAGGGVYCDDSCPTFTNCTISGNRAFTSNGGGIHCDNSSPTFTNCTVTMNTSIYNGGGICCSGREASPTLTDCTISANWGWSGGGLWSGSGAFPTLVGCTISMNSTICNDVAGGGGVTCYSSSPTLTDCTISGNTTVESGGDGSGGVMCSSSSPVLTNCFILENTASEMWRGAGGVYCLGNSSPTLTNCTIVGNAASNNSQGGGAVFCSDSSPTLTNCTITKNTVSDMSSGAGGVYCTGESFPTLTNCIVWDNSGESLAGLPQVRYSCVEGAAVFQGEGNINASPLFVGDADVRLERGSPCIDTGTFEGAPAADIEGIRRPCGIAIDMGAFEYCPVSRLVLSHAPIAECAPARVFVSLTNEYPVQEFSFGVAHDPAVVRLAAIDFEDCPVVQALNDGEEPYYWDVDLNAGTRDCPPGIAAGGTVHCIGSRIQSSTMTIPAGTDQPIVRLTYEAVPGNTIGTTSALTIVGCLGDHLPVEAIVTINDFPHIPDVVGGMLTVEAAECRFIRGDTNGDRRLDVADVLTVLMYLFEGMSGPLRCQDAGDANDDGRLNIADAVRILARLFLDGGALDPPYPSCGTDPTLDRLECGASTCQ